MTGLLGFGGIATPISILGGTLVAWFDARDVVPISGAVQDWTDRVGGFTASAIAVPQRPDFAVDGSNFLGRSCVQSALATGKFLTTGTLGGNIITDTAVPWMMVVGRLRTAYTAGAGRRIVTIAGGGNVALTLQPGTVDNTVNCNARGVGASGDLALNTSPHVLEGYFSASGEDMCAVDGTDSTAGPSGNTIGVNTSINIGSIDAIGNFVDDYNFAAIVIATTLPSAFKRNALRAWALAEWGVP